MPQRDRIFSLMKCRKHFIDLGEINLFLCSEISTQSVFPGFFIHTQLFFIVAFWNPVWIIIAREQVTAPAVIKKILLQCRGKCCFSGTGATVNADDHAILGIPLTPFLYFFV